jgi:hypothetical protein
MENAINTTEPTLPKILSKEAGLLLQSINQGMVNIPQLKSFLSKVEAASPSKRKQAINSRVLDYINRK